MIYYIFNTNASFTALLTSGQNYKILQGYKNHFNLIYKAFNPHEGLTATWLRLNRPQIDTTQDQTHLSHPLSQNPLGLFFT